MAKKNKRRAHGEGTVTQRKDGRWQGAFYTEDGKRHFVYGNTQQEALTKLRQALHDREQGTLATGPNVKLDAYMEQWLEEVQKPKLRISSYVKYKKLVYSYISPALGNIHLRKLTPQHIQSFYTKLMRRKLSAKTVHSVHGLLHNALDNAVRWGLVGRNVTEMVTLPRVEKYEGFVLTLQQARTLLVAARGHRLEVFMALALTTGMRRGELLALRWSDIDLETGILQVRHTVDYIARYGYVETEPKTKRSRRKILLPGFVMRMLGDHKRVQLEQRLKVGDAWQGFDLVVCGLEGGYFNPRYILKVFDKLLDEAEIPHMRIHDLRHSVLTMLSGMNVDTLSIQELAGHEDIATTLGVYGHFNPAMLQVIADKMEKLFTDDL